LPADTQEPTVVVPELSRSAVMIVTAAEIEASLLARRLGRWGASTCTVIDEKIAAALLPEPFETLTKFNPVYYMIGLVRYGFLGAGNNLVNHQ